MKPQVIKDLEKELDTTFEEVKELSPIANWLGKHAKYCTDDRRRINAIFISYIRNMDYIPLFFKYHDVNSIKYLQLKYCELKDISFLKELKNLTQLDLSSNQISDISFIKDLKKLRSLSLSSNQISDISFIKDLKNLWGLNLRSNQINNISPLKNLKRTINFNLRSNQIKILPKWITQFLVDIIWKEDGSGLNLYGNPIETPPIEIVKQGKQAIKDWFNSPKADNHEIKLILTGNTTAGKTSLLNFLMTGEYKETNNSTHGINIKRWKPFEDKELNVNIWDFGGQEYYHATHRLFLTSNSVYVLLWEKCKNKSDLFPTEIKISGKEKAEIKDLQHYDYSYWLKLIRKYDRPNQTGFQNLSGLSPIFMVQNKIDEAGNETEPTNDQLQKDFAVTGDYHISIKNAFEEKETNKKHWRKFNDFKQDLIDELQKAATGKEIQLYIANIREAIRQKQNENIWNWETYEKFCYDEAKAEMTAERMKILTQYLHDTGVILYFGYDEELPKESILRDTVFINPKYVCDTIYDILDYKVQEENGKFTKQHVIDVLGDCWYRRFESLD